MSSKRNPYENAMAKNFFSIRKSECIYRNKPTAFDEAKKIRTLDKFVFPVCRKFKVKYL